MGPGARPLQHPRRGYRPGFCRTAMAEAMPDKVLDKLRAQIPAGRLGDPEEVAHAAQFIFENDYFNGRILELDGGLRL
ncbi:SDR family oxidoreductase [Halomonas urmiana]|uniref:SDR family oxidoreductase n=1 Tax=Halomonas urmiana TaxID=490901 RepID=UPI003B849534